MDNGAVSALAIVYCLLLAACRLRHFRQRRHDQRRLFEYRDRRPGRGSGDSIVSMAKGAEAMRWNPAALGLLEEKDVSATHIQYYQDVHIENVSGRLPYRGRRSRRERLLPLARARWTGAT